jgi:1-acyl-sn-glycerol-3-phosphate acyltransferase
MPEARFVSKADVQHWPLVGKLVDGARTLYIERANKRDALRVVHQTADALKAGDTVAFFPEGTTGPGPELLPFHGNLLQAAIATGVSVQPLVLRWHEPELRFAKSAQFIGQMTLVQSLWSVACAQGLAIRLQWLPQVPVRHEDQRRELAERLREQIKAELARS